MDGYQQAERIDSIIYKLLEQFPIRKNYREWLKLNKTVITTIHIINQKCIEEYQLTRIEGGDV